MTIRSLTLVALLAAAAAASAPAFAQTYSTPMRDVENPDHAPFMVSAFGTLEPPFINGFLQFATPPGKRYFLDYVTLTCTTPGAGDTLTQAILGVQQRTSATTASGFGGPAIALVRRGPAPFGGYVWSGSANVKGMFSDPALGTTDGGTAISFNIYRTDSTLRVSCSGLVAGHTLPQ